MLYHAHERYLSALTDDYRRNSLMELKAKKIDSGDLEMSPPTLSYHLSKPISYTKQRIKFHFYELNLSILDKIIIWIPDLKGGKDEVSKIILYTDVFTIGSQCYCVMLLA